MSSTPFSRPKGTRHRAAFSLVLSLTVMAMLLLLCIGAAALLSVELRVAQASVSLAKARLNAMLGARIALGQLQSLAGNDRRITAPATILDPDIKSIKQPWLTGVWKGRSVGGDYQKTHDNAMLGWLASGVPSESDPKRRVEYPKSFALNGGALKMVSSAGRDTADKGRPELSYNTDSDEVFANPEPITDARGADSGSLAWWIADENMKANLSLRLPPATSTPTPADALAMARNAIRLGLKATGDGVFEQFPETLPFNVPSPSRDSLAFDSETPTAPAGFWLKDPHNHYHDITPYSESLLTDVVNGGFKYDLSLMLALDKLPDGYRDEGKVYPFYYDMETAPSLAGIQLAPAPVGLESTVPGAGPYAKAKGLWLNGLPDGTTLSAATLPVFNKLDWTGWPDVRSFARIYRFAEPAFKDTNSNLLLFDPRAGMQMTNSADRMNGAFYNGKTNTNTQNFLDRNAVNSVDMGNMTPWRTPIITALQMSLSVRAKPASTPGKYDLYLVVRPFLQLWNPYNVPLRFRNDQFDSLVLNVRCLPGKLSVTTKDAAGVVLEQKSWNDWTFNGGNYRPLFSLFVDARAESARPLAPGEVRVYSPPNPEITTRNTTSESATQVTPGLRPFGGYEFKIPLTEAFDGDVSVALVPNDGPGIAANPMGPATHISMDWMEGGNDGDNQRQCNGDGVRVEWNDDPEVALKIDSSATEVTQAQLQQAQAQAFARFTMRLRSETTSTQKSPFLAYGDVFRQVYHPKSVGSFRNNPEMKLSPFEFCHSKIRDDADLVPDNPPLDCDGNNHGRAFTGYTAGDGVDAMVLSHIPLAPIASIGDLRDARLGGGVSYHRLLQTIWDGHRDPITGFIKSPNVSTLLTGGRSVVQDPLGNSFGHPMIPADKITAPSAHASENYYDFSWIMNSSIWDAYCATGFSPENSSVPEFAGRDLDKLADDFLIKGGSLPNRRILFRDYGPGGAAIKDLLVKSGTQPTDEAFAKAPAAMSVNGGFNINSTSVRAWRALLAGLNRSVLPQITTATSLAAPTVSTEIDSPGVALRNPIQSGPLTDETKSDFNKERTLAGRKLSEAQITELAQKIVEQVKLRGPFLSLGEFMNRRLEKGSLGERGAIQAAIDATKINDFAKGGSVKQVSDGDAGGFPNPAAIVGSQARGMPGVVCQADIVTPLATQLTARSDTFVIRAAGTSEEGATAYVEMVVRRDANYLDTANEPFAPPNDPAKPLKVANKVFGRRFTLVAVRWLDREDI